MGLGGFDGSSLIVISFSSLDLVVAFFSSQGVFVRFNSGTSIESGNSCKIYRFILIVFVMKSVIVICRRQKKVLQSFFEKSVSEETGSAGLIGIVLLLGVGLNKFANCRHLTRSLHF